MSNEINAAGKDLVVESLTEIGSSGSNRRVSEIKRMVDAKLIKRDYDKLKTQIGELASDGIISPSDKKQLYREWKSMMSSNSVYLSQAESCGIDGQQVYLRYAGAFSALNEQLSDLLEDMTGSSDISGIDLLGLFDEYYDSASLLEEEIYRYQTGLLNGLDDRTKCELHLACSSGLALPSDGSPATLLVTLLKDGVDATSEMLDEDFVWSRTDGSWPTRTGKTIAIANDDLVDGTANFTCRFVHHYSESMYWYAFSFITVQRTVVGDSWNVEIENTIEKYKPGQPETARYVAHVRLNGKEVTDTLPDSAFRWVRTSKYSPNDDEQWNRDHASGYRMIEFTTAGPESAASFKLLVFV